MTAHRSTVTRGLLWRWVGWFGLCNAALFALVGVRYLLVFGWPEGALAMLYVVAVFVSHFVVLGVVPLLVCLTPIIVFWPRQRALLVTGVLIASVCLSLMVLDTNVFVQNRFHLSALSVALFDTATWLLTGLIWVALLGLEAMLAGHVWGFVSRRRQRYGGRVAALVVGAALTGHGIHIWADATAYSPVTSFTRFLPVYFPMKAKRRLAALGWVDPAVVEQQRLLRGARTPGGGQLRYPLKPLDCAADAAELPNILIVLVDALRPDRISPQTTPTIAAFRDRAQQFTQHYSGGNSSRMGLFSMFYGVPSTYWQTFYDLQRQPVLLEQLATSGYQLQAFSSVGFGSPSQIDRTVFAGLGPAARQVPEADHGYADTNAAITVQFDDWLRSRGTTAPYFGFLYYDPGNFATQTAPVTVSATALSAKESAYMQGIAGVDANIATVLTAVEAQHEPRDTLIVIASDHGYEFDELGLGYVGHASNYGPWQLRSTLLIDWPERVPAVFTHRSAHQDLPATLLSEVLGCANPPADYSSGSNLFAQESWRWLIAGSYTSHAIVQPEQTVVTYPGGLIELLGPDYRPDPALELDAALMQEAMLEMRRFYK